MATNKFIQGTTIKAKAEFRNSGNVLVDPTEVFLKYKQPDGVVITKTYSLTEITKVSTGLYEAYVTLDQSGQYVLRWEGTGYDGSVSETVIQVIASKVLN